MDEGSNFEEAYSGLKAAIGNTGTQAAGQVEPPPLQANASAGDTQPGTTSGIMPSEAYRD
ncbi:hypothetical protein KAU08_04385, partial [bacterium]|nr:hypothetical protein [bacterium]